MFLLLVETKWMLFHSHGATLAGFSVLYADKPEVYFGQSWLSTYGSWLSWKSHRQKTILFI